MADYYQLAGWLVGCLVGEGLSFLVTVHDIKHIKQYT